MKEKNEKPKLTIKIGRCIEGMNLVIPEHCSREEREHLESEYQKFCRRAEEEKILWIANLQELIPSVFDGDNRIEIECMEEKSINIEMKDFIKNMKEEGERFNESSDVIQTDMENQFLKRLQELKKTSMNQKSEKPKKERQKPYFVQILVLLFVTARLFGFIDWSWWIVFSPLIIALIFIIFDETMNHKKR